MTQTPRNNHTCGSHRAISPGVRRIPEPIVFPMMTARPKPTPSTRSKDPRAEAPDFGADAIFGWVSVAKQLSHSQIGGGFERRAADAADYGGAIAADQRVTHLACALRAVERRWPGGLSHWSAHCS